MSRIKEEQVNEGRGQHEWDYLPLCEPRTVRKQIEQRIKLDSSYQMKKFQSSNPLMSNGVPIFEEPILCTYMDQDELIDTCEQSPMQLYVVEQQMLGYMKIDIAEHQGVTKQTLNVHINRAVDRIIKRNREKNEACLRRYANR